MSNVYQLEPPTVGKVRLASCCAVAPRRPLSGRTKLQVVLVTSLGDIEIELWPKEAPKVCSALAQLMSQQLTKLTARGAAGLPQLRAAMSRYVSSRGFAPLPCAWRTSHYRMFVSCT